MKIVDRMPKDTSLLGQAKGRKGLCLAINEGQDMRAESYIPHVWRLARKRLCPPFRPRYPFSGGLTSCKKDDIVFNMMAGSTNLMAGGWHVSS